MPDLRQLQATMNAVCEVLHSHETQCTEIVRFIWPAGDYECGQTAIGVCAYCGTGVCIKHSDTCVEGCVLHSGCLSEHEKETGHRTEVPRHG